MKHTLQTLRYFSTHIKPKYTKENLVGLINAVDEMWRKRSFKYNQDNTNHLNIIDSLGSDLNRGNFFTRYYEDRKSKLKVVGDDEVLKSNIIAFGGMDYDTPVHMSALLKSLEQLFGKSNSSLQEYNINTIAYQSLHNRSERYRHIQNYCKDPTYTSEEFIDFTKKYIIPRFTNMDTLGPLPLILYSFSASGREVSMIENAFRILLKENNINESGIETLFSWIRVVSIGYTANLSYSLPKCRFDRISFYSKEDYAGLLPDSFESLYASENFTTPAVKKIKTAVDTNHDLYYIFGEGLLTQELNGKKNVSGHSLPHYIDTIIKKLDKDDLEFILGFMDHNKLEGFDKIRSEVTELSKGTRRF